MAAGLLGLLALPHLFPVTRRFDSGLEISTPGLKFATFDPFWPEFVCSKQYMLIVRYFGYLYSDRFLAGRRGQWLKSREEAPGKRYRHPPFAGPRSAAVTLRDVRGVVPAARAEAVRRGRRRAEEGSGGDHDEAKLPKMSSCIMIVICTLFCKSQRRFAQLHQFSQKEADVADVL